MRRFLFLSSDKFPINPSSVAQRPTKLVRLLLTIFVTVGLFSWALESSARADSGWRAELTRALKNGGAYAEDDRGRALFEYRAEEHFVPASILKLATVSAALNALGPDYRFKTETYLLPGGVLAVKGFGDPHLVSEELAALAAELAPKVSAVHGILLDDSYFAPDIEIDGSSDTSNPYDAKNGALIANFNTINVEKRRGAIVSAEPQTPLTPLARELAARLPSGTGRVNLQSDRGKTLRYFGELLSEFLRNAGTKVDGPVRAGTVPRDAKPLLIHHSRQTLSEIVRDLLKYSTNFTANQVLLVLGASQSGAPATVQKGVDAVTGYLRKNIGWRDFEIHEGAGLSHRNAVTPAQMVNLLRVIEPYRELIPEEEPPFQAKTGSLRGVNTLAGYFDLPGRGTVRFALLVNDNVDHRYKFKVARMLYNGLLSERGRSN
ncbi:MAG: D-alanyl-D-alanine carboxypeptidase [Bdellovibrionota bacterium]